MAQVTAQCNDESILRISPGQNVGGCACLFSKRSRIGCPRGGAPNDQRIPLFIEPTEKSHSNHDIDQN